MNAINRVVMVVLLLTVAVACSLVLVMPVRILDAFARQATAVADSIRQLGGWPSPDWIRRAAAGGVLAVILDLTILFLIFLEVRRPARKAIRVEQAAGGEVQVNVASIADRLRHETDALSGVLRSKPRVSGKRRGVVVELDVETAAGLDVPRKAEEIVEMARQVVEERMGLKLARPPKVNLRATPYSKMSGIPTRPEESEEPEPEEWAPLPVPIPEVPAVSPEEPKAESSEEPEDELITLLEDYSDES